MSRRAFHRSVLICGTALGALLAGCGTDDAPVETATITPTAEAAVTSTTETTAGTATTAETAATARDEEPAEQPSTTTTAVPEAEIEDLVFGPPVGSDPPGLDPVFDDLWERCRDGDEGGGVCDELFWDVPLGSEFRAYELFGGTCGGRSARVACVDLLGGETAKDVPIGSYRDRLGHWDTSRIPATDAASPGENQTLDDLWTACGAGTADACTTLFGDAPIDSVYEAFGGSCGGRLTIPAASCPATLLPAAERPAPGADPPGLDPTLDALWSECRPGNGEACLDLFLAADEEPYNYWAATCGGYIDTNIVLSSCTDWAGEADADG
ncbi:MAG: hypothetical protein AAF547_09415 [Actinomycetota bacterium]